MVSEGDLLRLSNACHVDVREFGVRYLGDRFTAFVGFGQAFWGVTEVRHLVDIVNQADGAEDLDVRTPFVKKLFGFLSGDEGFKRNWGRPTGIAPFG